MIHRELLQLLSLVSKTGITCKVQELIVPISAVQAQELIVPISAVQAKDPEGQIARWTVFLSTFDFEIQYRPGQRLLNADALS